MTPRIASPSPAGIDRRPSSDEHPSSSGFTNPPSSRYAPSGHPLPRPLDNGPQSGVIATDWKAELGWGEAQFEEVRLSAYSYLKEGKWEEAVTLFKALLTIDPESSEDWQTLSALYLQKGEHELCLECSEKALALEPRDESTKLNRAKALLVLGQLNEGRELATSLLSAESEPICHSAEALLLAYSFS